MVSEVPAGPVVTVITVVYNAQATLEATMLSVLAQDWPHIEYLVVDGGSTDGTLDIIQRHASRLSGWVSERDRGIYDAMNKGLRLATGEWVHFLNAGDRFAAQDVLTRCMEAVGPGDGVVYGDCLVEYGGFVRFQKAEGPQRLPFGLPFSHQALLVKREPSARIGFALHEGTSADYGMIARLDRMGLAFRHVPRPIAVFQAGGVSDTRRIASLRAAWAISRRCFGPRWDTTVYFSRALLSESFKALLKLVAGGAFMDRLRAWKHRKPHGSDSSA